MTTLAEVTLEQFLKIAKEEGVVNEAQVEEIWRSRPTHSEYDETKLRGTFKFFKSNINRS